MSKTSQRKRSAYELGMRDAVAGDPFRWERHPFLHWYRDGYQAGLVQRKQAEPEKAWGNSWLGRLMGRLFGGSQ